MKNKINYKHLTVLVIVLFLSIGFAYLTSNLEIRGVGLLKKTTWDIYLSNVDILKGKELVVDPPTTTGMNTKEIEYSVDFNTPGDVFQFSVDVVNNSTLDAMITLLSNTNLSDEELSFADYSITYINGDKIEEKNFLAKQKSDTLLVTITYRKDIEESDLLQAEKQINFNLQLQYGQVDDSHDERENSNIKIEDLSGKNNDATIYRARLEDDMLSINPLSKENMDEYVLCGLYSYDFKNSASMVVRFRVNELHSGENFLLGNWESSGFD